MIKAIIFDCFGVLTTDAWLPFKQSQFGHDQDLYDQATEFSQQANAGFITHSQFAQSISDLAGLSVEKVEQNIRRNVANELLFDWINAHKDMYKIGLLSNASENWLPRLFTDEQMGLIDATALSYETGYTKPKELAFASIADMLNVEHGACVMVDDQVRHCTGAREAGMQAILYSDFDLFRQEIELMLNQSE